MVSIYQRQGQAMKLLVSPFATVKWAIAKSKSRAVVNVAPVATASDKGDYRYQSDVSS
jgi:hypothetical protein